MPNIGKPHVGNNSTTNGKKRQRLDNGEPLSDSEFARRYFPFPPPGHEKLFDAWAAKCMEIHGQKTPTPELIYALMEYSWSVLDWQSEKEYEDILAKLYQRAAKSISMVWEYDRCKEWIDKIESKLTKDSGKARRMVGAKKRFEDAKERVEMQLGHDIAPEPQKNSISRSSNACHSTLMSNQDAKDVETNTIDCKPYRRGEPRGSIISNEGSADHSDEGDTQSIGNEELDGLAKECKKVATVNVSNDCSAYLFSKLSGYGSSSSSSSNSDRKIYTTTSCWHDFKARWQPLKGTLMIIQVIGQGRSGIVCSGIFNNNQVVALKLCNLDSHARILEEIDQEVKVYQELTSLQGTDIPKLYSYGLVTIQDKVFAALMLEHIVDRLDASGPERQECISRYDQSTRQMVVDILERIHRLGCTQRDARPENVLFEQKQGKIVPRLIDLAFGQTNATPQDMRKDREKWKEVLQL